MNEEELIDDEQEHLDMSTMHHLRNADLVS